MFRNFIFKLILTFSAIFLANKDIFAETPPNILWIVSEDNSPFIGAYGDSFATTPHLDNMALEGALYKNAFATAPVCAPARCTLITGVYPNATGTQHMRSNYPIPDHIKFFPRYLREAGYYTSNNAKKDYNTIDQPEAWDESSNKATYKNRRPNQPFFAVFNLGISHESSLHQPLENLNHDPEKVPIPPYHPHTKDMKYDLARYYDKIEQMDSQVGKILKELEEAGLAENTIVFYFSDHGGVLGRSKRFMYESGLHIPLIIRFPKRYEKLAPVNPGSKTDRIVTFVDFAPTVLSLAGISIPKYIHGAAFLGKQEGPEREYAFGFRGRMGDRIDMIRTVRDKKYRYIRNYMPHKIYGQYIDYLWQAPSMQSWETAFEAGELNEVQSKFWKPKPVEELFDIEADPHNINNLADQPQYKKTLIRMREANRQWQREIKDVGFMPEAMISEIANKITLYEYTRSNEYSLEKIMKIAEMASSRNPLLLNDIIIRLSDKEPIIRYWAVIGCIILEQKSAPAKNILMNLLHDPEISIRISAAEALYILGETELSVNTLKETLNSRNRMARLQSLNVLETMNEDAVPAFEAIKSIIPIDDSKKSEYDISAAKRLLKKIQSN